MLKLNIHHILLLLLALLLATGCSVTNDDSESSTYTVEVDSIDVPPEVASDDTLFVGLTGTIGPNGCHSLERFDASRTSSSLDLQIIGRVDENDGACTGAVVPLDTTYTVPPPLEGPFEINIQQPEDSVLTRTVRIIE